MLAALALPLALLAAALLTLVVALFTFAPLPGFLIGSGDGVDACACNAPHDLGRPSDHGDACSRDRSDEAALQHGAAAKDHRDGAGEFRCALEGVGHGWFSRDISINRERVNGS
jgi:hypothetical protein